MMCTLFSFLVVSISSSLSDASDVGVCGGSASESQCAPLLKGPRNDSISFIQRAASFLPPGAQESLVGSEEALIYEEITPEPSLVTYEPHRWNDDAKVLRSHNCYEYALNDIDTDAVEKCADMLDNGKQYRSCRRWFHIPGYTHQMVTMRGAPMRRYQRNSTTCPSMLKRVASDNIQNLIWRNAEGELLKGHDNCPGAGPASPSSHYLAALVVDPGHGFHFYRRDHLCRAVENAGKLCWSHKPGSNPVIREDGLQREMPDLDRAARHYGTRHTEDGKKEHKIYTDVCGYFCVPGNDVASTRSSFFLHRRSGSGRKL